MADCNSGDTCVLREERASFTALTNTVELTVGKLDDQGKENPAL